MTHEFFPDGVLLVSCACYRNDRLKVVNVGMNRLQDRYEWRSGEIGTGCKLSGNPSRLFELQEAFSSEHLRAGRR